MKNPNLLFVAMVISIMTSVGCSTSGGKQEVALNHETTSRDVKGSIAEVNSRVQEVFSQMGIAVTGTQSKNSGQEQDLNGKTGDKTVSVELNQIADGMTHVNVSAKEGTFQWDEDYARNILSKVIAKS